jgi:Holliday junction resolvase RusA-like endonuclease
MNLDLYTVYDLPVPYKTIKIYPVLVKDYAPFFTYSECLTLDKNSIPDPRIISMSYLEYLFFCTKNDINNTPYLLWLDRLLGICLKDDRSFDSIEESIKRYNYDEKGKPYIQIGEDLFYASDFEDIKKIICEQNMIELVDENIQKEVRDSLEKARAYKEKLSGTKAGSFEDYIISISVTTGWSFEYVYNMSVRKFTKSIRRLDNLIHYKIYLSATMSGMVEFKDKSFIKHWLTDLDSDSKFGDVEMNLDDVANKVSLESAKT